MVLASPRGTFRDFQRIDHPPGDGRQKPPQVIAAEPAKLGGHLGRPILKAHLPAIDVRADQRFAGGQTDVRRQLRHQTGEVDVHGLLAQLVAFQPLARRRRRRVERAGRV